MRSNEEAICRQLRESGSLKLKLAEDPAAIETIRRMADALIACLRGGRTVYVMGNGGSAADAQHIAGELVGRFRRERGGFACVALSTDTSILTSVANDYGFEDVFARQVCALVRPGDIAWGISTSGASKNVIKALMMAREKGATTLGLSGGDGGPLAQIADICFSAPSSDTPRVQECHITVAHILCGLVEDALCGEPSGSDEP
jgi:D-sedoheptulose 7-phosphate isomerase